MSIYAVVLAVLIIFGSLFCFAWRLVGIKDTLWAFGVAAAALALVASSMFLGNLIFPITGG